jgi:uncharacterized membrane protein SirB2
MISYATLKAAHVTFAILSGGGFLLRGWWMLRDTSLLNHPVTRVLPHINDSLLLITAVWLAVWSGQYPLAQDWLTVKLVALLCYIVLGSFALKRGRTRTIRLSASIGAVLMFAYIAAVALTRTPWPPGLL